MVSFATVNSDMSYRAFADKIREEIERNKLYKSKTATSFQPGESVL